MINQSSRHKYILDNLTKWLEKELYACNLYLRIDDETHEEKDLIKHAASKLCLESTLEKIYELEKVSEEK